VKRNQIKIYKIQPGRGDTKACGKAEDKDGRSRREGGGRLG